MPTECAKCPQGVPDAHRVRKCPQSAQNIDFFKSLLGRQNDFKLASLAREIPLIFIGLVAHPVGTVAHPVGVWRTLWAFGAPCGHFGAPCGHFGALCGHFVSRAAAKAVLK